MRVKRINLPFTQLVENEEEEAVNDTMDSFKPLETHHGNGMLNFESCLILKVYLQVS